MLYFIIKGRIFFEKKRAFFAIRENSENFNREKIFQTQNIYFTFHYKLDFLLKNLEIAIIKKLSTAFMEVKSFSAAAMFSENIRNKEIVEEQKKFRRNLSEKDQEISRLEVEIENKELNLKELQKFEGKKVEYLSEEDSNRFEKTFESKIILFGQENNEFKRRNQMTKEKISKFVLKMNDLFENKEEQELKLVKTSSFKKK